MDLSVLGNEKKFDLTIRSNKRGLNWGADANRYFMPVLFWVSFKFPPQGSGRCVRLDIFCITQTIGSDVEVSLNRRGTGVMTEGQRVCICHRHPLLLLFFLGWDEFDSAGRRDEL